MMKNCFWHFQLYYWISFFFSFSLGFMVFKKKTQNQIQELTNLKRSISLPTYRASKVTKTTFIIEDKNETTYIRGLKNIHRRQDKNNLYSGASKHFHRR